MARTEIIKSLSEIADGYDILLCDVWGCYHNGVAPYTAAVDALRQFRAGGGVVALLTNAPRPGHAVQRHLDAMSAPRTSYDTIVSSGDSARAVIESHQFGRRLHIVGPEKDRAIWEGADVEPAPLKDCDAILCTGLFDDRFETPADYVNLVKAGVAQDIPLLCANPDIIVDRGAQRLYCAGAIAREYARAGGRVQYFGKPHLPIYELALRRVGQFASAVSPQRVLCIGDGIATDVLGAENAGLACLFISGGLAAAEVGENPDHPDPVRIEGYLHRNQRQPRYTLGRLR